MRILSLSASLCLLLLTGGLIGCTDKSDSTPSDGVIADSGIMTPSDDAGVTPQPDAGGPKDCTACLPNQVCVEGACVSVPASCPCPKETYCDLATTSCKVGCTSDTECSTGRICDTTKRVCFTGCRTDAACGSGKICDNLACKVGCRTDAVCSAGNICDNLMCRAGCRTDAACGAGKICNMTTKVCQTGCRKDTDCSGSGQVCDTTTNTCRTGCRTNANCAKEQICDTTASKCVAGCDTDTRCNSGRICESSMCVDGCRSSATCALGTYCDTVTTKKCKPGCNADKTRCNVGEACVRYVDGSYKCQSNCYGWDCNGTGWECYKVGSDSAGARCRQTCSDDSDCSTVGHRCTWFTKNASYPGAYSTQYCAQPCTVAGCMLCVDGYGTTGTSSCDTATKECRNVAGVGYQTSPSYGL